MVIDRRCLMIGSTLLLVCGCGRAHGRPSASGCFNGSGGSSVHPEVIKRSGDDDFDYALAQTLGMICEAFGVRPGFGYYEDVQMNAYATPESYTGRADGTVMFGLNFLRHLRATSESPAVAAATVCAHEFGHILQFKLGLRARLLAGQPTVKRSELQADFFAGYFTGLRKRRRETYPAASAALTQYDVGDNLFYEPSHHGTSEERGAAVVRGFAAGKAGKSLDETVEESTAFVMDL